MVFIYMFILNVGLFFFFLFRFRFYTVGPVRLERSGKAFLH